MAFKYLGNWQELSKEADKHKNAINQRYRELFGDENYKRLEEVSNRLLVPESFFSTREEWKKRFKDKLPEKTSNKMGLIVDYSKTKLELDENGRLIDKKIRTSPVFYISQEGTENSDSASFTDNPLASYVHEFNHFSSYVLQKTPLYLARMILLSKISPKSVRVGDKEVKEAIENGKDLEDMLNKFLLNSVAESLKEFFEKTNHVLDYQVLKTIGINVPLNWRGKNREYDFFPMPNRKLIAFPIAGDPFKNQSDEEVIRCSLNWEKNFNSFLKLPYFMNFYDSLKQVKVSRVPITELLEGAGK